MSFYIKPYALDLGDTTLENIFITEFMPTANGTHVKVYLLGLKYAQESSTEGFNHQSIAKILNIPTSEVWEAWHHWEKAKIVVRHFNASGSDFDIEFLSIKEQFIYHNYIMKGQTAPIKKDRPMTSSQQLVLQSVQRNFKTVCVQIEKILNIPQLSYSDRLKINDYLEHYYSDSDVLLYIVDWAQKNRTLKSVHQLKPILNELLNQNCKNLEDVKYYLSTKDKKMANYKSVLATLGQPYKLPNQGQKDAIDLWLNVYGFKLEELNKIIAHLCKKTNSINLNYIETVLKDLYDHKVMTFDGYVQYNKDRHTKTNVSPTSGGQKQGSFDIFEGRSKQYTDEELEDLLNINKFK